MNLFNWLKAQITRPARHRTAWSSFEQTDENGLTLFQRRCNEALIRELFYFPYMQDEQQIEGDTEKIITGTLPKTHIKYWIYKDGAQVGDYYYLDGQDFDTPEQLIASFTRIAKETTQYGDQ